MNESIGLTAAESRLQMWKAESEFIPDREKKITESLALFGHRNWIVVTDSAYPAQSKPGIETVVIDANHMRVVSRVFSAISASRHVRAKTYVDKELSFVAERDAPGVQDFRNELDALLGSKNGSSNFRPIPSDEELMSSKATLRFQ